MKRQINSLYEDYMKMLPQNLSDETESIRRMNEYILHSTAQCHGYYVKSPYIPRLLAEEDVEIFRECIRVLMGIFEKVAMHYRKDEAYRRLFGFEPDLERLILKEKNYKCILPIARIDIFYNDETGGYKFCEFNTDGSSAMNEDLELNRAVRLTDAFQRFEKEYEIQSFELFDSWVKVFLEIYGDYRDHCIKQSVRDNAPANSPVEKERQAAFINAGSKIPPKLPNVAILDFTEAGSTFEFQEFKRHFEAAGCTTVIADARDLKYIKGEGLFTKEGIRLDAIYRRAVTSDVMKHYRQVQDLLEAYMDDAVCLIGDFSTQLFHNKQLFEVIQRPETFAFLTPRECEWISEHFPRTLELSDIKRRPAGSGPDSDRPADVTVGYDQVLSNREEWIIKPKDSYGSKGVYAGVEFGPEEWKEKVDACLDQNYILQEFCRPYYRDNIELDPQGNPIKRPYSNLTGLFSYGEAFVGAYSRTSVSDMISTQYNERSTATLVAKKRSHVKEI